MVWYIFMLSRQYFEWFWLFSYSTDNHYLIMLIEWEKEICIHCFLVFYTQTSVIGFWDSISFLSQGSYLLFGQRDMHSRRNTLNEQRCCLINGCPNHQCCNSGNAHLCLKVSGWHMQTLFSSLCALPVAFFLLISICNLMCTKKGGEGRKNKN